MSTVQPDGAERGSGTVLTLGIVGFVLTVFVAWVIVGGAVLAAHQAASAADLAAIGAARTVLMGGEPDDACGEARKVAADNGAQVSRCTVRGREATVDAVVPVPPPVRTLGFTDATSRARAGVR